MFKSGLDVFVTVYILWRELPKGLPPSLGRLDLKSQELLSVAKLLLFFFVYLEVVLLLTDKSIINNREVKSLVSLNLKSNPRATEGQNDSSDKRRCGSV